jgi:hypothetical protein
MFTRVFNFLFGNVPVQFPSDFPLAESVARLRARTKRSAFVSLFERSAAGPVTESRVRLQRMIPFFGNSFKPIFVGAFTQNHRRVVLEGRFTMFLFSKVFMTIWLSFALAWAILAEFVVLRTVSNDPGRLADGAMALSFPLVGLVFFAAGIGFIRGCWWLSRNDMAYLTSVIRSALSPGGSRATAGTPR